MKIFSKRKTDEEYIKGIMSLYNKRWYLYSIGLVIAITIISCTLYFAYEFDNKNIEMFKEMKFDEKQTDKEYNENIDKMQYVLGARIGYNFASLLYSGIGLFIISINAILGQRKNKLLIDLYEKSRDMKKTFE